MRLNKKFIATEIEVVPTQEGRFLSVESLVSVTPLLSPEEATRLAIYLVEYAEQYVAQKRKSK